MTLPTFDIPTLAVLTLADRVVITCPTREAAAQWAGLLALYGTVRGPWATAEAEAWVVSASSTVAAPTRFYRPMGRRS